MPGLTRSDSAMFEMPVPKEKPGPGRPPKYGKQIKVDDFELVPVPQTDYHVGVRTVQARIFGDKPITAIVTRQEEQESRRVFSAQTWRPATSFSSILKYSPKEMHKPIFLQMQTLFPWLSTACAGK